MTPHPVDPMRLRIARDAPVRADGDYVLYWMTAQRRPSHSAALDHAVRRARELAKPLLVLEPLDLDYRWACERFHTFIIQGMRDHRRAFDRPGVAYHPYVEPRAGHGRGLLAALAERSCLVIADEHPAYRWPALLDRAVARVPARIEAVDGCGVLPLRLAAKDYVRAVDFRRFLHKTFLADPPALPSPDPLAALPALPIAVPQPVLERWPAADPDALLAPGATARLGVDPTVGAVADKVGGPTQGAAQLRRFLARLGNYVERNHPDEDAASGLSPWLHFGHVGAAQVVQAVLDREEWSPDLMDRSRIAKQQGAWGIGEGAQAFLEEILTWRELSFHTAFREPVDHARYEGLPAWARKTLAEHAADPREGDYDLETLAQGGTDDPLWNAAQRELRETGVMHNYLRMLWGKRVLAWTPSPQRAFQVLVELNNRYALDGRDPNSYGGISWVFGRYDRAWGPERPVYGKIRYMTSQSTLRKLRLRDYLERWGRRRG